MEISLTLVSLCIPYLLDRPLSIRFSIDIMDEQFYFHLPFRLESPLRGSVLVHTSFSYF